MDVDTVFRLDMTFETDWSLHSKTLSLHCSNFFIVILIALPVMLNGSVGDVDGSRAGDVDGRAGDVHGRPDDVDRRAGNVRGRAGDVHVGL